MIEKLIFNVLAFALFTLMFFKLIAKNDTSYVYVLVMQFIGIAINFIELIVGKSFGVFCKIIVYTFSVIIPIIIIWLEYKKNIKVFEILYLSVANLFTIMDKNDEAIKYLKRIVEKNENNSKAHELLAKNYEKLEKLELLL